MSGSIIQRSALLTVSGTDITLLSNTGIGVGSDELISVPIAVQLVGTSGALTAITTTGDIEINGVAGELRIGAITTLGGNVKLEADQSIVQVSSESPAIKGNRIELVSHYGSIGRTGNLPLNVEVGQTDESRLTATAPGNISIRQVSGDLRLDRVESFGGDVTLEVANGSMVDANSGEQKDKRTYTELLELWNEMLLLGQGAEQSAENTLQAYKNAKEYEYHRYWRMRNVRPVSEPNGQITYVADDYNPDHQDPEYHRLHEIYGSFDYSPNWQYSLTDDERNALTEGSSWTENELSLALSGGILFKQATSTATVIEDPNVIGHNITLRAPGGSIGTDDGYLEIDGNDPNALKNDDTRVALAAAEPDDVIVDPDTKIITVLRRQSIDIAATGAVDVQATGHVYLGSIDPIYVKTVSSQDSIRIKGKDGIYSVTAPGQVSIQGKRTILEGGDGGIGTADTPLILSLLEGAQLTARAAEIIHIHETNGNLNLAEIFSLSDVDLFAKGSILDSRGRRPVAVMGGAVNLESAEGLIGHSSNPLAIGVSPTGELKATAFGGVFVKSPSIILNLGNISISGADGMSRQIEVEGSGEELNVLGKISSDSLILNAGGSLRVAGEIWVSVGVTLNASKDILLSEGSLISASSGYIALNARSILQDAISQLSGGLITASRMDQHLIGDNRLFSFSTTYGGGGSIKLRNTGDTLELGTLVGDETADVDIEITNIGNIGIVGAIRTTGYVKLTANGGAISQSGLGKVESAESLETSSANGQTLLGSNSVKGFSATNSGSEAIKLRNAADRLVVADVSQASGGDVEIVNTGDIELAGTIDTTGNVTLTATGSIEESGAGRVINAAELTTASGSGQALTGANTVKSFSASNTVSGDIKLNNEAATLVVADVTQGSGGLVLISNTGDIELTGTIDSTGDVALAATGSIEESGAGRVINAALLATASGSGQALTGDNAVQSILATNTGSGDIELVNIADLIIGRISQNTGDIIVSSTGYVTVNAAVTSNDGDIQIHAGQDITVAESISTAGNVDLAAGGSIVQTGAGKIQNAALLKITSGSGQTLTMANTIRSFLATNTGVGDIRLFNLADLTISGISQNAGDIVVDNAGDITVAGSVVATAGDILIQAGRDIAVAESISTAGNVDLTAGGSIAEAGDGRIENAALLSTQSSGGQTLTAANSVRSFLATNTGSGNIELVNTADLAIAGISQETGDIIVDNTGNVTVAGSVVTAGGDILMQVAQDITIADSITTASNVSLTAGGSIMQTGEGRIKNAALLSTQSSSGQALTGANTVKAIDAVNTGTGDIEFANAEALTVARVVQNAGDVIIISTGDLDVAGPISIAVSGSVELRAVGNLTVDASTEAGDGGDITLEASGDESDAILNASLAGNGDISMTAGRDISIGERIGTVGAVELVAGGQIFETGSGRIEAAELVASSGSGQTLLSANTIRSFTSVNTGAGDIVLNNTAGVLDLESISQAGGGVVVFNDGDLRVHRIMAPAGKVRLRATGSILAATGSAFRVDDGGATNVQAMDIELTAVAGSIGDSASRLFVTASGDTTAWAARDVRLGVRNGNLSSQSIISEAGSIDLVVGDGSVGIKDLRAAGSIDIEALHSALIEQVTAVSLDLALTGIGSSLSVVRASVREYVEASADSIVFLELAHTGTEPLGLSITGGSRSMADTVAVYATSDAGIAFDRLVADLSFIDARVDDLLFRQVIVGRQAEMRNRYRKVIADNVAQKLFACDVQLYPGSDPFYLFMIADGKTMTDALVFNYSQDYIAEGYAGSGNTLVETAEAILEAAGHQPTWVVDYYEQAVMTSLSAGRTNVILYIPSSPSIGITESDADETEETDEGGDTTHE